MSNVTGLGMKQLKLEDMNKDQLMEFIDAFEIDGFTKRNGEASMIEAIIASGKYTGGLKETGGGVQTNEKGNRVHKILGEYKKVKVHSLDGIEDIFVGLGMYEANFASGTVVHLPEQIIELIKTSGHGKHYYDPASVSQNGTLGEHKHKIVPNYIIEPVE